MNPLKVILLSLGVICAATCIVNAMTGGWVELLLFTPAAAWVLFEGARL